MRTNAIGSPHTHLVSTQSREDALTCARLCGPRYVVREDYGVYFVVPKDDPGYAGIGILVAESLR